MSSSRLLVAFACVFVVALTVEDREIENYIKEILFSFNDNIPDVVSGRVRNYAFLSNDRLFFYANGTELLASLDGSEFIIVTHLFPNEPIVSEEKSDEFFGSVNEHVFSLTENGTDYKLTEVEDENEFTVIRIRKPSEEFKVSEEENATHVEVKIFIRRVNEVYSKLPF